MTPGMIVASIVHRIQCFGFRHILYRWGTSQLLFEHRHTSSWPCFSFSEESVANSSETQKSQSSCLDSQGRPGTISNWMGWYSIDLDKDITIIWLDTLLWVDLSPWGTCTRLSANLKGLPAILQNPREYVPLWLGADLMELNSGQSAAVQKVVRLRPRFNPSGMALEWSVIRWSSSAKSLKWCFDCSLI